MADNIFKAVATFPYKDDLARDVAENVFYFNSPSTNDAGEIGPIIRDAMRDFYTATPDGADNSISSYFGFLLKRDSWFVSLYNVDPATGHTGPPVLVYRATADLPVLSTALTTDGIPNEVALCASYGGTHDTSGESSTLPVASRFGRIYVGPFNASALSVTGTGFPVPTPDLVNAMVGAMNALTSTGGSEDPPYQYCLWSAKHKHLTIIERGWVDNAWDTQRRRGVDPTARTQWIAT